jgi:proteasome lid subunit RPN8/RPN11
MSNMTPFEIRLELLKMAKDMLVEDYFARREELSNDWQVKVESARNAGLTPPEHPRYPAYPSEADIIAKAQSLNGFVSQIPTEAKPKKS